MLKTAETQDSGTLNPSAIAVIGVGCLFPDAQGVDEFWDNIQQGRDSIVPIPMTHWDPSEYFDSDAKRPDFTYAKTGGFLKPFAFDPLKYGLSPHALEATDSTQLLGMVAALQALTDAGYGPEREFDRNKVSCILGVTGTLELVIPLGARLGHPIWKKALREAGVDEAKAAAVMESISAAYVPWQENSFPGLLGNVVAGRIANRLDLGGTNSVVDAACASSLAALHTAIMELESKRADMVITGGMDTFNDIFMYMCFSKTPALSPTGHSRPFDANGDGTILGEGLGAVILKRLEDAERDGDRIYAVIRGVGSSSDGKGQAIYAPSSKGQVKALKRAYERAGVKANSIGLLEAHGTGTKVGDGVEIAALNEVYRADQSDGIWCQLGSVKSQIGHTKAAAGAAGLIKAIMALYHKVLPPTIKVSEPHPKLVGSPFSLSDRARPWVKTEEPRRAAVSAFGFGGSNYHCVLEEYNSQKSDVAWDPNLFAGLFSAPDRAGLVAKLEQAIHSWSSGHELRSLVRSFRKEFSEEDALRLGFSAHGAEAFAKSLQDALDGLRNEGRAWPNSIVFSDKRASGPLAFIYAGQGSQELGMLGELACRFPEFSASLDLGEKILRDAEGRHVSLSKLIYPDQVFDEEKKSEQFKKLTETRYAQLSLGVLGLGAVEVLRRFGIEAEFHAGHSFGELVALYGAGAWDAEAFLSAAYQRGRWMSEKALPGGGMLAVMASRERIEMFLQESQLDLQIANDNAPEQVVLGGSWETIAEAEKQLKKLRIGSKKLAVSSAFHTRFVADAVVPFGQELEKIHWQKPSRQVFANTSAALYPDEPSAISALLAGQIKEPVQFHKMLKALHAEGARTFVEIGPGRKLQGLLKSSLGDEGQVLAFDSHVDRSLQGLAALLIRLSVAGYPVRWEAWDPGKADWNVPSGRFHVMISGANYRSPQAHSQSAASKVSQTAKETTLLHAEKVSPLTEMSSPSTVKRLDQQPVSVTAAAPKVTSKENHRYNPEPRAPRGEPKMSSSRVEDSQRLNQLLQEMQDLQRRTTEAHTLFLENQRQFQAMLRGVLFQEGAVANLADLPSERTVPSEFARSVQVMASAPARAAAAKPVEAQIVEQLSRPVVNVVAEPSKVPTRKGAARAEVGAAENVLKIIAAATGYPQEMLTPSMSLEADLGIDSIKKVEIFSQVQAEYPTMAAEAEHLNSVQAISDLISLCEAGSGQTVAEADASDRVGAWAASQVALAASDSAKGLDAIRTVIAAKTGFPEEMLQPVMDLEADLGIDSIKRVEIFSSLQEQFPQLATLGPDHLSQARTIADIESLVTGSSESISPNHGATAAPKSEDARQALVLGIVSEKTGYPQAVLEAEMDLEADLGIDSIKRVEIISALSEALPVLQTLAPESLASLKTLGDLMKLEKQGDDGLADLLLDPNSATAWDLSAKKKADPSPSELKEEPAESLTESVVEETRAVESSHSTWERLDISQLVATPVVLAQNARSWVQGSHVWIVDDGSNLARNMMLKLQERGVQARLVSLAMQDRLQVPEDLSCLLLLAPLKFEMPPLKWLQQAFRLLRKVGPSLQSHAAESMVVTISRHGGRFGLDGLQQLAQAYTGAVASFAKTVHHEWPGIHARALDLGKDFTDGFEAALRCLDAAVLEGPLELGVTRDQWFELQLEEFLSEDLNQSTELSIEAGEPILVTGGARGVTAACLRPLAECYQPHFVIWGRTALAAEEPSYLRGLNDPAVIKRELLTHDAGLQHPRALEQAYRQLIQQRELRENISALKNLGAQVSYEVVDVRQEKDLSEAVRSFNERYGSPAAVIHGAGVIRDRLLLEQKDEEWSEVIDTKLRILPHLEHWVQAGTRAIVLFSSSTARQGRKGQVAYCVANEALNKGAQYLHSLGAHVLALNWGPWDGGMVQEGLKKLFAEEGIGTIPLAAGAELLSDLLSRGPKGAQEWVVLAGDGKSRRQGATREEGATRSITVSTELTPILADHVLKHRAVVPAALLLEWLAGTAREKNPQLAVQRIEHFQVWKGLVLDADQSKIVCPLVKKREEKGKSVEIDVVLEGDESQGIAQPHAHALVVLGAIEEGNVPVQVLPDFSQAEIWSQLRLYDDVLFHGESLALIKKVLHCDEKEFWCQVKLQGAPADWAEQGMHAEWNVNAPLLDAIFQAAIVWNHIQNGQRCLPSQLLGLRQFASVAIDQTLWIQLQVQTQEKHRLRFAVHVLTESGKVLWEIESIETIVDASLNLSFAQKDTGAAAESL